MAEVPDKPALEGLEAKWDAAWETAGTYLFDQGVASGVGCGWRSWGGLV